MNKDRLQIGDSLVSSATDLNTGQDVRSTVQIVGIVHRPEDEEEAMRICRELAVGLADNQGLVEERNLLDNELIKEKVDPGAFYIIEG